MSFFPIKIQALLEVHSRKKNTSMYVLPNNVLLRLQKKTPYVALPTQQKRVSLWEQAREPSTCFPCLTLAHSPLCVQTYLYKGTALQIFIQSLETYLPTSLQNVSQQQKRSLVLIKR